MNTSFITVTAHSRWSAVPSTSVFHVEMLKICDSLLTSEVSEMFTVEDQPLISIHANPLYSANIPSTWHQPACVQNTKRLLISGTFCG